MTEMQQGMVETNNTTQPVEQVQQPAAEKLLKQSEVNELVGRAKHEAVERYKRSLSQEPIDTQRATQHTSIGNAYTPEQIRQLAAEEAERLRNEWIQDAQRTEQEKQAQRIANDFFNKLSAGKSKYEDFDKLLEQVNLPAYANAVQLSNEIENTADVWYHLLNDPLKLEAINLMAERSPVAAKAQMKRLSESLKANADAANVKMPNAPLDHMKPSNTGTDNRVLSVSDYRRKYIV